MAPSAKYHVVDGLPHAALERAAVAALAPRHVPFAEQLDVRLDDGREAADGADLGIERDRLAGAGRERERQGADRPAVADERDRRVRGVGRARIHQIDRRREEPGRALGEIQRVGRTRLSVECTILHGQDGDEQGEQGQPQQARKCQAAEQVGHVMAFPGTFASRGDADDRMLS